MFLDLKVCVGANPGNLKATAWNLDLMVLQQVVIRLQQTSKLCDSRVRGEIMLMDDDPVEVHT